MVIITGWRISAFALSLNQEHQGKHVLLNNSNTWSLPGQRQMSSAGIHNSGLKIYPL